MSRDTDITIDSTTDLSDIPNQATEIIEVDTVDSDMVDETAEMSVVSDGSATADPVEIEAVEDSQKPDSKRRMLIIALIASALIILLLLASCVFGSGGTAEEVKEATPRTSKETTTTKSDKPKDKRDDKRTVKVIDEDGNEIEVDLNDPDVTVNADGTITTSRGTVTPTQPANNPSGGSGSGGNTNSGNNSGGGGNAPTTGGGGNTGGGSGGGNTTPPKPEPIPIYCCNGVPHPVTREEPNMVERPMFITVTKIHCSCGLIFDTNAQWTAHNKQIMIETMGGGHSWSGRTEQVPNGTEWVQDGFKTVVICAERKIIGYR